MALFQRFWRRLTVISHAERLITDEPSSVGEIVMIGAGRIEHRELNYYTIRKATFFGPPTAGPHRNAFGPSLPLMSGGNGCQE